MTSTSIYHYVYRITNIVENKHYYGKRSSRISPTLDLGIKYISSSTDTAFITDQKNNPQNYRYKIVRILSSSKEACELEIILHEKFDVGRNQKFYNKCAAKSTGFDRTGLATSSKTKEKLSKAITGSKLSDETKAKISAGGKGKPKSKEHRAKISAVQIGKKCPQRSPPDRVKRPEFVGPKMPRGVRERRRLGITDEEFRIKQENTKQKRSKTCKELQKGTNTYTNGDGSCVRLRTDDPRVLSGEFFSPLKKERFTLVYKCQVCENSYTKIFTDIELEHYTERNLFLCSKQCANRRRAIAK